MKKTYVLAFEWSESPYHQGTFSVFLAYHRHSGRWALSASRSPSGERLSWTKGNGSEDPREITIKLLRQSYDRGALEFDLIVDNGPWGISRADFLPQKTREVETDEPIEPPRRICEYCRHLKRPQGMAANMARLFDCDLGNWSDRERGIKNRAGVRSPNLEFTCAEFEPVFKKEKEVYYG